MHVIAPQSNRNGKEWGRGKLRVRGKAQHTQGVDVYYSIISSVWGLGYPGYIGGGGVPNWALDGGSPMSLVDFKNCGISLSLIFLNVTCRI